jgi:hypothetical protein
MEPARAQLADGIPDGHFFFFDGVLKGILGHRADYITICRF